MSLIQDFLNDVELTDLSGLDAPVTLTRDIWPDDVAHSTSGRWRMMRSEKIAPFYSRLMESNPVGQGVAEIVRPPAGGYVWLVVALSPVVVDGDASEFPCEGLLFRDAEDASASSWPEGLPVALLDGTILSGKLPLVLHAETVIPEDWRAWIDSDPWGTYRRRRALLVELRDALPRPGEPDDGLYRRVSDVMRSARLDREWMDQRLADLMERPAGVPMARAIDRMIEEL